MKKSLRSGVMGKSLGVKNDMRKSYRFKSRKVT